MKGVERWKLRNINKKLFPRFLLKLELSAKHAWFKKNGMKDIELKKFTK